MPFVHVALMSTRFFHSARLDGLADALTDEATPPDRGQPRRVRG